MTDERLNAPAGYEISTDTARLDHELIHRWLSQDAYWALGRSRDQQDRAIAGSLNFGAYQAGSNNQSGYARAVTDYATFAWLCDVYVDRAARGQGLGTALAAAARDYLAPYGLRRILLATKDAHGVYAQLGFTALAAPDRWMALGELFLAGKRSHADCRVIPRLSPIRAHVAPSSRARRTHPVRCCSTWAPAAAIRGRFSSTWSALVACSPAASCGAGLGGPSTSWAHQATQRTYQAERHPIGRRVLLQSGLMMRAVTLHPRPARWLRDRLAPRLLALPPVRDALAGSFAGTGLRYGRGSGEHSLVGTRATEVPLAEGGLAALQRQPGFVLILGRDEPMSPFMEERVTIARRTDAGPALLVRPDGYVAWAGPAATAGPAWRAVLDRWTGGRPARVRA